MRWLQLFHYKYRRAVFTKILGHIFFHLKDTWKYLHMVNFRNSARCMPRRAYLNWLWPYTNSPRNHWISSFYTLTYRVLKLARKKRSERVFLQANLKTRVNYFSVFDQNNQINCLLHFHPYFTFEFSHSAVMISYQNNSTQCMNFKRHSLVWKSVAILFSLQCKNHPVLEIQTQKCHESWTGLSRKSYLIFV